MSNKLNWPDRSLSYLCRSYDQLYRGSTYEEAERHERTMQRDIEKLKDKNAELEDQNAKLEEENAKKDERIANWKPK